jgi:hypothetical protein
VQILSVKDLFTKPLLPVILPERIMPAYNMKRIKPKEGTLPLEEEQLRKAIFKKSLEVKI